MNSPFANASANIATNPLLRTPQRLAHQALVDLAATPDPERDAAIVLPVGCGKSGCIALAPFAFGARRVLVIAPNVAIAKQLARDFDPASRSYFYTRFGVLTDGGPFPEPADIRGTTANRGDLDAAHVVITNIHQLQGTKNRWLRTLPADYFDLLLFDEGHHNTAASWTVLREKFPAARVVSYSATPVRGNGDLMLGRILYAHPVGDAVKAGYVKFLSSHALNPATLKFCREDEPDIEIGLDDVRMLGELDAEFRRSIVSSDETLQTIVDASIGELRRLRAESGESRLKIIACALNLAHCGQVTRAYAQAGMRADFVHSKRDAAANRDVMRRLSRHELDVIVQVRKLGEGFDHPLLSVAAVFNIFGHLSPFVQFVGRIMRVIRQNAPEALINRGVVVFHAGADIASRWQDFRQFSKADQDYFDELLSPERRKRRRVKRKVLPRLPPDPLSVHDQTWLDVEVIPLVDAEPALDMSPRVSSVGDVGPDLAPGRPRPVLTTLVHERRERRAALAEQIPGEVKDILQSRGIHARACSPERRHFGRPYFAVLKAAVDKHVNALAGVKSGQRAELTRAQLDEIDAGFDSAVLRAVAEVFRG